MSRSLKQCWRRKRDDVLAIGGILLFFVIFFSWTLFIEKDVIAGDSLFYNYPLRTIAWKMISSGELPLWTPHVFSGYPLLSMAQLGLAYPLTWTYLLLPGYIAEKIIVLTPFLLAPLFTYLYLRSVKRSALGSLLGALTFGYGGMMASPGSNSGFITNPVMWLPLMLIILNEARRRRLIPCLVAATIVYSLSVLTGHVQSFIIVGLISGAYALWLVLFFKDGNAKVLSSPTSLSDRLRPALVALGAGVLSIGIATFQILESSHAVSLSVRSALSYELFTQGSYKPTDLWNSFLTPLFYVIDMPAYVTPVAAALAFIALIKHFWLEGIYRDNRVFFWGWLALVGVVLMMGQYTRVYRILYYIPLINLFRVPSRHAIEWTFAASVLAAYGWDALTPFIRRWRTRQRSDLTTFYTALGLLVIALVVGVQWWTTAGSPANNAPQAQTIYYVWKTTFVVLLLAALWRAGLVLSHSRRNLILGVIILVTCFVEPSLLINRWWTQNATPPSRFRHPSEITQFLNQFPAAENRVYTRAVLMAEQEPDVPRFDAPNLSGMWGRHEVAGYEPLILRRYSRALGGVWMDGVHRPDSGQPDPGLLSEQSHVLDLLNTKFIVTYANLATSMPNIGVSTLKPPVSWKPVYENRNVVVWQNSRALPRAWLVSDAVSVNSETALKRIRGEGGEPFDPHRTALLEVPQAEVPPLPGGPPSTNAFARITHYQANRLTIETWSPTSTVLVVSEIFYPGWEVTVDEKPERVLIANYLLRGVALPAGLHKVEMRYAAPRARTGAIISILTLGLLAGLAVYSRQHWLSLAEDTPTKRTLNSFSKPYLVWLRSRISSLPDWSREISIVGGFLLLTALMTWPWVLNLRNAVSDTGDPYMIAWTLWWDYYQTFRDPLRLFHANIFYPFQYSLAFSEHDYGIAILFFPLFAAGFRPLTVHSIATFVGFASCGYGAFRLTRTLTNSTAAGWIAGIVFAYVPFRFQLLTHLHYLFAAWLPLTLEALVLFVRERNWKRAAWFGFVFLMNGLTSITWMLYSLLPLTVAAVVLVVRHRVHRDRRLWQRGLTSLLAAFLILSPFLWPYYQVQKLYNFKWPKSEAVRFSAGVADWFSAGTRNHLWSELGQGLPDVTNHLFPGLLAILLSIVAVLLAQPDNSQGLRHTGTPASIDPPPSTSNRGISKANSNAASADIRRTRWVRLFDAMIFAAFIIAVLGVGYHKTGPRFFRGATADRALTILVVLTAIRLSVAYPPLLRRGPHRNLLESLRSSTRTDADWLGLVWAIAGFLTALGTNFFFNRLLSHSLLPYESLRVPSRAAMICYVGLAVLSGVGALRLAAYLARKSKRFKVSVVLTLIIVALIYELNAVPLTFVKGAVDPDALSLVLKETPMRGGLVELPSDGIDFPIHHAMLRAADHQRPLVNAASTFTSPYSRRVDEFTNGSTIPTNEFLDLLERVPTSYVAVRHQRIPTERRNVFAAFLEEARNSGRLRLVGSYDNGDELYVVTKTEPEAR